jgi:hypothetical protein
MKLRLVGLSIAVSVALGIVASVSAHEFVASNTGSLKATGGEQVFTTSAGKVQCESLSGNGTETTTKTLSLSWVVTYGGCQAFGSKVTITATEDLFDANEAVGVLSKVVITSATGKCSVLVTPGGANATLKTIKYTNIAGGKIELSSSITGINYTPSGGICGTAKLNTNGTYVGKATAELVGGSIGWS